MGVFMVFVTYTYYIKYAKMCKSHLCNLHIFTRLLFCVPREARTLDPLIKSQFLVLILCKLRAVYLKCYHFVTILLGRSMVVEQHLLNKPSIPLAHISYIFSHVSERIALRVYSVNDAWVVLVTEVPIHDR